MSIMRTRIIKIGNSQGLRIPKLLLEQLDSPEEVELAIQGNQLIVRPLHPPRHDWEQQFQAMAANDDDQLIDEVVPSLSPWDEEEWEW